MLPSPTALATATFSEIFIHAKQAAFHWPLKRSKGANLTMAGHQENFGWTAPSFFLPTSSGVRFIAAKLRKPRFRLGAESVSQSVGGGKGRKEEEDGVWEGVSPLNEEIQLQRRRRRPLPGSCNFVRARKFLSFSCTRWSKSTNSAIKFKTLLASSRKM